MSAPFLQTPDVMDLGAFALVVPNEGQRLTARTWADIAMAVVLDAEGKHDPAKAIISAVETRLGVNDAHRRAIATSAEVVRKGIRDAARRRKLEAAHLAATAGAPLRDASITTEIEGALAKAAQARVEIATLKAGGEKKNRRAIKALEKRAKGYEDKALALQQKERDQDQLFGEARDPILLARARGEDVSAGEAETAEFARDEYGARIMERKRGPRGEFYYVPALVYGRGLRAKKAVGIEHAFAQGYLDGGPGHPEALYQTGQQYAEAYEADEGLTSSRGEGGGGFGPKGPQLRQIEAGEMLAAMRKPLTPRERAVLDLVCGQGLRLRAAAELLKAGAPATQRALRSGLKAACSAWGDALDRGGVGAAADRARRGARLLKRVRL